MEEYGKQQYNQGVKDVAKNAKVKTEFKSTGDYSGYDHVTVDKESILELLKP